jgi:hypothetical protein
MNSAKWPRLSQTLPRPREYQRCQSCGQVAEKTWQECDDSDLPEPAVFVRLCRPCSVRLVGQHPRLYMQISNGGPAPGAMACCVGCKHQQALRCTSPKFKANGGPGMRILANQVGIACSRGKGGGCRPIFDGDPQCTGREPAAVPTADSQEATT